MLERVSPIEWENVVLYGQYAFPVPPAKAASKRQVLPWIGGEVEFS